VSVGALRQLTREWLGGGEELVEGAAGDLALI
jgi:hypothetical protein